MKRTPLKRKTRLKSGGSLPPVNRKRAGHRFPKGVDKALRVWVREQPCLLQGRFLPWSLHICRGRIQAHHVRSRGAGGGDRGNLVALCQRAHQRGHAVGWKSFAAFWGIDLKAEAARLAARYLEENGTP